MEHAQKELEVVADAVAVVDGQAVKELTEVQLILVGGGFGEISPH